jgi:hypothetical protein
MLTAETKGPLTSTAEWDQAEWEGWRKFSEVEEKYAGFRRQPFSDFFEDIISGESRIMDCPEAGCWMRGAEPVGFPCF